MRHALQVRAAAVVCLALAMAPQCFGPSAALAASTDTQVVVSTGIGSTAEAAAKNAAENALTQVVGTFVDTETQIRKRKEIRDGISSLSRAVDTRMSEFSQGSISSFQTLDARQEGGLFRVEAKVGVRLSEFKTYVKKLSSDETSLGTDIFAQVAASERNATGAREILLRKVLMPALLGEVSDVRTGRPLVYAQQDEALKQALAADTKGRITPTTILVPVDISFRDGFLQNALAAFEEIASGKERLNISTRAMCASRLPNEAFQHHGIVVGVNSFVGPPTLYLFNDVVSGPQQHQAERQWKLRDASTWNLGFFDNGFASFVISQSEKLPKLKVTIKGEGGSVLREITDPKDASLYVVKDPRFQYGHDGTESRLAHLNIGSAYDLGCFGVQRGVALFPERRIYVVMNYPAAELAAVKAVEVGLYLP